MLSPRSLWQVLCIAGFVVGDVLAERRVGFRDLSPGIWNEPNIEVDGLDLLINDACVFARGAVWTPIDPVGMAPSEAELRAAEADETGCHCPDGRAARAAVNHVHAPHAHA